MISAKQPAHVVIVGGGFGGLSAAKIFGRSKEIKVTLVDRRNHHLFQPLLYQVATAALSPAEIATPIRTVLAPFKNITVLLGNVTSVNTQNNFVLYENTQVHFDYLILACGAKHTYFGHPEWEEFAPGLKTLEQATEIRRRILLAFELAEREADLSLRQEYLRFVVVGGGPTGVELAGAIAEIGRQTLAADFRAIDTSSIEVILIEASDRILSSFDPSLSERAKRDLQKLGVEVRTNTRVTNVNGNGVEIGEESIASRTVIWAAGVQPSSLNQSLNTEKDRLGRIVVEKDLRVQGAPRVFVIGDQCAFKTTDEKILPGLAPVAMQQGRHVAYNILRLMNGARTEEFKYLDKGQMATIGRRAAIVEYKNLKFNGILAWLCWLFIHIFYLIGFRNRLLVFIEWAWSYATFTRGARLIVDKEWRSSPKIT